MEIENQPRLNIKINLKSNLNCNTYISAVPDC